MRKFKCRCIKNLDHFNFEVGRVYEGVISAFETGVTILGVNQETYFAQAIFEKYFEVI